MTQEWDDYVAWTQTTVVNPGRDKAELMEIWGLGLGGELAEFLVENHEEHGKVFHLYIDALWAPKKLPIGPETKKELGDLLYYLARCYFETHNTWADKSIPYNRPSVVGIVRAVGQVVEIVKKALRGEGRTGLYRLCDPQSEVSYSRNGEHFFGRSEEFGGYLDEAVSQIDYWLASRGSSLKEIIDINKEKLLARKKAGTLSAQENRP